MSTGSRWNSLRRGGMLAVAAVAGSVWCASSALGQGTTSWTYQGQLTSGGSPANGTFDFRLRLYASAAGADQVGQTICFDNIPVTNGLVELQPNFGLAFDVNARFLEIDIRADTGLTCSNATGFTVLGQRQRVRSAPFALYATDSGSVGGIAASLIARRDTAQTFLEELTINDVDPLLLTLQSSSTAGSSLRLRSDSSARSFDLVATGTASAEGSDRFVVRDVTSGISALTVEGGNGFVGIGTTNPSRLLDVRDGAIRVATDVAGGGAVELSVNGNEHGQVNVIAETGFLYVVLGESQAAGAANVGGQVIVCNAQGVGRGALQMNSAGNCSLIAQIKNFMESNPDDPSTDIYYASIEGPEAAMYTRGTGQLSNGRAVIALPRHFTALAATEGVTVQVTPLSAECNGLAVVSKGPGGFEVRELMRGTSNAAFDWEVKAVRKGYEDYQVVRPAGLLTPKHQRAQ